MATAAHLAGGLSGRAGPEWQRERAATGKLGAQVRPRWLIEEYEGGLLDPVRLPRHVLVDLTTALGT